MTVAEQITRIKENIQNCYSEIETKGGELPDVLNSDNLSGAIQTIKTSDNTTINALLTRTITSYENDEITSLGAYALAQCSSMTGVSLPNMTSIGLMGLYGCNKLTSVSFPKLQTVGSSAFNACTRLVKAEIPLVTSLGSNAFSGCTALTSFFIPSTCTTITATSATAGPFRNCTSLVIYTDIASEEDIPSGFGTYWNYANTGSEIEVVYNYSYEDYVENFLN